MLLSCNCDLWEPSAPAAVVQQIGKSAGPSVDLATAAAARVLWEPHKASQGGRGVSTIPSLAGPKPLSLFFSLFVVSEKAADDRRYLRTPSPPIEGEGSPPYSSKTLAKPVGGSTCASQKPRSTVRIIFQRWSLASPLLH